LVAGLLLALSAAGRAWAGDREDCFTNPEPAAASGGFDALLKALESGQAGKPVAPTMSPETTKMLAACNRLATQGDAQVQHRLGSIYYLGIGVVADCAMALEWYRKAADQGLAKAQVAVGSTYEFGCGGSRDSVEAAKWYAKAAAQLNGDAMYDLGDMYEIG